MLRIVTDSTADLPVYYYEEYSVEVVPLYINFGETTYKENVDLTNEEFYRQLRDFEPHGIPTTSQPTPQDFLETYKRIPEDQILSIHISSGLSGTCQSANIAKDMVAEKDITVVDSGLVSAGLGMLVLAAGRAIQRGLDKTKIVELLEELKKRIRVYFTVETLNYLKKGGRIGKAQALLGTILHIIPILSLEEGIIVPVEKMRGRKRVLPKYRELIRSWVSGEGPIDAILVHADCEESARELREMLKDNFVCRELIVSTVGGVVGSHAGPGTWGLAICPAEM